MAAPTPVKLGPGTLTVGETGTVFDASCLVENAAVSWSVDTEDDINVLCGDTVPGARTYTATIAGTFLQDLDSQSGFVAFTWEHKGEKVPILYMPNDDAGAEVTGTVVINPLDVGTTDDYGTVMTSDFEWDFVGEPELSWNGLRSTSTGSSSTSSDYSTTGAA